MVKGLLSKGIKLSYADSATGTFTEIPDLQEIPSLGGQIDKVETTTLADGAHTYIHGLIEYGDLAFKFLYDNSGSTSNYRICKGMEADYVTDPMKQHYFKVEFPDAVTTSGTGTIFAFSGQAQASVDQLGTNAAATFTLNIALSSEIAVTDPT